MDHATWDQVIGLYPYLVDCTTCTSSQVCKALKEALYQYQNLLVAPSGKLTNGTASEWDIFVISTDSAEVFIFSGNLERFGMYG